MVPKANFLPSQDDFTAADFADMTASLLYSMFQSKTAHPLHAAVRLRREDVVFLYLIEHSQEVSNNYRVTHLHVDLLY